MPTWSLQKCKNNKEHSSLDFYKKQYDLLLELFKILRIRTTTVNYATTIHIEHATTIHIEHATTIHIEHASTIHIEHATTIHIEHAATIHIEHATTIHIEHATTYVALLLFHTFLI